MIVQVCASWFYFGIFQMLKYMIHVHVYVNGAFDLGVIDEHVWEGCLSNFDKMGFCFQITVEEECYISHSIKPLQVLLHDQGRKELIQYRDCSLFTRSRTSEQAQLNGKCMIYFIRWLPESPRWLLVKGRFEEIVDVFIRRAATVNRLPVRDMMTYTTQQLSEMEQHKKSADKSPQIQSFKNILRTPTLLKRLIGMCYIW